jgi:hypothetical protein
VDAANAQARDQILVNDDELWTMVGALKSAGFEVLR